MTGPAAPHRAYRLRLDLEADDPLQLQYAIEAIAYRLDEASHHCPVDITSGGTSSGWHLSVTHNTEQTADGYREQLDQYVQHLRHARRSA